MTSRTRRRPAMSVHARRGRVREVGVNGISTLYGRAGRPLPSPALSWRKVTLGRAYLRVRSDLLGRRASSLVAHMAEPPRARGAHGTRALDSDARRALVRWRLRPEPGDEYAEDTALFPMPSSRTHCNRHSRLYRPRFRPWAEPGISTVPPPARARRRRHLYDEPATRRPGRRFRLGHPGPLAADLALPAFLRAPCVGTAAPPRTGQRPTRSSGPFDGLSAEYNLGLRPRHQVGTGKPGTTHAVLMSLPTDREWT